MSTTTTTTTTTTTIRIARPAADGEESALLLKAYKAIDFKTVNQAQYKKALNARNGKHAAPNRGVRGGCRDYKARIAALTSFYELSYDDQKKANKSFTSDATPALKAQCKSNIEYLNSNAAKVAAFRGHPRCLAIAQELNFDLLANFDDGLDEDASEDGPATAATTAADAATAAAAALILEEDFKLKAYLAIDLDNVNQAKYKKALNARRGKHAAPNRGLRGGCRDYKARIAALTSFYELGYEDQKKANKAYSKDSSTALKKRHKKNLFFLNRLPVKARAIRNHSNPARSTAIAAELNLDITGVDIAADDEFEDEDEDLDPYIHTGLASSNDAISNLLSLRSDSRLERNRRKPTFKDKPTKTSQLGRVVCSKAELVAWKMVARANDSTYLENPPPGAPKRTTISISINEVKDTTKSGGVMGKKLRRLKPKLHIVANSQADFSYVMNVLYESNSR